MNTQSLNEKVTLSLLLLLLTIIDVRIGQNSEKFGNKKNILYHLPTILFSPVQSQFSLQTNFLYPHTNLNFFGGITC